MNSEEEREREKEGEPLSLISRWRLSFLAVLGQISPQDPLSLSLEHVFLSRCLKAISCVQ